MAEVKVYTLSAEAGRTVALPEVWFGAEINKHTMYQATRAERTNARAGTASTKTRSEVRGGGAKPWRQKGTGRARAGTSRSPLWTGGGVIFGPTPKKWRERVPRQVRRKAFASALSDRAANEQVRVVEIESFETPKTARLAKALETWEVGAGRTLLLTTTFDENVFKSGRNMPRLTIKKFADASALDVLSADVIVVEEGAWDSRIGGGPSDG